MSILKPRSIVLLSAFFLFSIAVFACSSTEDSQEPDRPSGASYKTCQGFITADDVEQISGVTGLIDRVQVIEVDSITGLTENGAVANCLIDVFRTVDGTDTPAPGDSLSLSIVQFDTSEQVLSLYNSLLATTILTAEQLGDQADIEQGVIGSDSYYMDVKVGGIGAIVVLVSDKTFVSMSAASDSEDNALLDVRELITAAEQVQSRLP